MTERPSEESTSYVGIRFDKNINLGHILTVLTLIVTLVVGWTKLDSRQTFLEGIQVRQQSTLDSLTATIQQFGRIEEKINNLDRRITEIERRLQQLERQK